ncbi:MAG: antitoxin HicB [Hydrocarboniphaga sp.]|uniref:type II toxin-antitoxin system HicB family antitoxin n=1 Tax=Hydrocarboniphaga sp. TaxID=2033016 RepID=UPI002602352B|nr:type II toxin-antitoxin system HicB family antitoxin [Hydrocarboniphaga sp.]MDB5971939.1 antitoxin HicB [Hydrocarboniphaga sp.]
MNTMTYKDYAARVDFDPRDRIFVGHLAGVRDIVGFHGRSVEELEQAFHEAVDGYVAACRSLGQAPERPASGKLMLRIAPEDHAAALRAAELAGVSLNQWAGDALRRASQVD